MARDFETLANAYLDGTIAPAEREELDAILRGDAEKASAFRGLLALDGLLTGRFGALREPKEILARVQADELDRTTSTVLDAIKSGAYRPQPAPRAPSARWIAVGAAAAALLVLAAALVLALRGPRKQEQIAKAAPKLPPEVAQIVEFKDGAPDVLRGEATLHVQAGDRLRAGDVVRSGAAGRVQLQFLKPLSTELEETLVALDPDSAVKLLVTEGGATRVALEDGAVACAVAPRRKELAFAVSTPHATATVVGTRFRVQVADAETRLEVKEGAVQFGRASTGANGEQDVLVRAGFFASARSNTPIGPPKAMARHAAAPPPLSRIALYGFLSEENYPYKGKGDGAKAPARYLLTDKEGNKYRLPVAPPAKNGAPPTADPAPFVGKLVRVEGKGTVRKAWIDRGDRNEPKEREKEKKESRKFELLQIIEIREVKGSLDEHRELERAEPPGQDGAGTSPGQPAPGEPEHYAPDGSQEEQP